MSIQDYKTNLIDLYIQYDTILDRFEKKKNTNEMDVYYSKTLLSFHQKINRLTDELKEFDLELRLQHKNERRNKDIQQELEELNLYYTILSKLSPITYGLTEYYLQQKHELEYKQCQLCYKVFKGKDYLSRYQQHVKDKHN